VALKGEHGRESGDENDEKKQGRLLLSWARTRLVGQNRKEQTQKKKGGKSSKNHRLLKENQGRVTQKIPENLRNQKLRGGKETQLGKQRSARGKGELAAR